MEIKLDKRYPLDVDAARAWTVLRDVKTVAECLPGASITEQVDATHYKGAVKVKVGPANAAFSGDIEVLGLDEAARLLKLLGKGADRGGSSASMELTATVEAGEAPGTSVLVGQAAVVVNGKFAQFGGRLMVQVSDMLLAQFADNFRAAAASVPAAPAVATPFVDASAANELPPLAAAAPAAAATPARTVAPPPAKANEINGLTIAWQLVKGWVGGLFRKRPA